VEGGRFLTVVPVSARTRLYKPQAKIAEFLVGILSGIEYLRDLDLGPNPLALAAKRLGEASAPLLPSSLWPRALPAPKDSRRMLFGAALAGVGLVLFRQGLQGDEASALLGRQRLDPLGIAIALVCSRVIAMGAIWGRRVMPGRDPMVTSLSASSVPPW